MPALMRKWGQRLESKLVALTEASSRESHQTLAKWIAFNRKRSRDFAITFKDLIIKSDVGRQALYLQVLNEILVDEKSSTKWDRLADLRSIIGEGVVLEVADQLGSASQEKLQGTLLKEWDQSNVFGGPTLINQIRRKITASQQQSLSESPSKTVQQEAENSPKSSSPEQRKGNSDSTIADDRIDKIAIVNHSDKTTILTKESTDDIVKKAGKDSSSVKSTSASPAVVSKESVSYDFESKGIPAGTVDPKEFLEHCKTIATLQIARDLRNDGAVQLSSLLATMPEDVRKICKKVADGNTSIDLPEVQARDFSKRTNEVLVDMNLDEQLQNVKTFRATVDRQRQSRKELIRLLIKSRCKFGADEAAAAFYEAENTKEELRKRARILADAMELEGLDMVDHKANSAADKKEPDEGLAPFTWYKKETSEDDTSPQTKRQKVT